MSQRGGAVVSHFRMADHALASDLVLGRADLVIALDPLEALRYVQYLRDDGAIVTSANAFVNISDYPPIEDVLERVAHAGREHVLSDADCLARAAGSSRASNMAVLGAASHLLTFGVADLEAAIDELFRPAGERVREVNRRAFRFGADHARAYREALQRGGTSRAVRHWLATVPPEHLATAESVVDATHFTFEATGADVLSGAEAHAFERILVNAYESGRRQLYEHEVYTLVQLVGAIAPPRHALVRRGEAVTRELVERFPGDKLVLKVVSPDVVHKSDAQGVAFVPRELAAVEREVARMATAFAPHAEGVLLVEHVPEARAGFGSELFVGIRATRELGPVIAAGIGGLDTEFLAKKMRPRAAVAKAVAHDVTAEEFLELFRATAIYDILTGRARGHRAVVSDGELLRCFRAFLVMAQRFCVDRGAEGPDLLELEVNPFAFRHGRLIPLDGRGRMQRAWEPAGAAPARARAHAAGAADHRRARRLDERGRLRAHHPAEPHRLRRAARPADGREARRRRHRRRGLRARHRGAAGFDRPARARPRPRPSRRPSSCAWPASGKFARPSSSPAASARPRAARRWRASSPPPSPRCARDRAARCSSGRTRWASCRARGATTRSSSRARARHKRWSAPARRLALVSQSGAFMLSRLSSREGLDPALAIRLGNQADVSLGDLVTVIAERDDIDVIGVYAEGFMDEARPDRRVHTRGQEDEWLWGWDDTPGIVSVGRGRRPGHGLAAAERHRRSRARGGTIPAGLLLTDWMISGISACSWSRAAERALVTFRELEGPGELRYLVSSEKARTFTGAILQGASRRLGRSIAHLRELGKDSVLALPPEEQYLVATGRTYFRDLAFDDLRRLQFDLETTGLDPARDRIFMIAVRDPEGRVEILEAAGDDMEAEADLIRRLVAKVQAADPDVIENHNLHGFDLPFLHTRARRLRVPWAVPHRRGGSARMRGPPWNGERGRETSGASHRSGPRTDRHPRRCPRSRFRHA